VSWRKVLFRYAVRRAAGRAFNLRALSPLERMQLVLRLPSVVRLSYHLFLDDRVPLEAKAVTLGVIGLVLSPIDVPGWVPVIGQLGDALVIVNVLDAFIMAAPRYVVREHIRELGLEGRLEV
jgi:uncharacterized membrane protein YkvA (DUF1232 family)